MNKLVILEVPTETQNVILTPSKNILRKVEILAKRRNMSLSDFLVQLFEDLVIQEDAFKQAKQRNFEMMSRGFDLGTNGQINWKREELHKR
jgi:hypothetical protein